MMSQYQVASETAPAVKGEEEARPYRTNQIGEQPVNKR